MTVFVMQGTTENKIVLPVFWEIMSTEILIKKQSKD